MDLKAIADALRRGYRRADEEVTGFMRGVLGPAYQPLEDAANLFSPVQDVQMMQQGGENMFRGMAEGSPWRVVRGQAEGLTGLLSMAGPGDELLDVGGPLAKAIFAGAAAKTADKAALKTAQELAQQGADARRIWDETGWFQGADGKWRFEIDDSAAYDDAAAALADVQETAAAAGMKYGEAGSRETVPLSGVLGHKELYEAYPELSEGVSTVFLPPSRMDGAYGRYGGGFIALDESRVASGLPQKSPLLHETQHAIQGREGFARGGSPEAMAAEFARKRARLSALETEAGEAALEESAKIMDDLVAGRITEAEAVAAERALYARVPALAEAHKLVAEIGGQGGDMNAAYRRLAGEVEARNVQTRMDMTPEQRRATPPWETEDVARPHQIIRYR